MALKGRRRTKTRSKRRSKTRRKLRGGSFLKDITLCILSWKSPKTVRNTLETYKKTNLLNLITPCIYIQERTEETDLMAREYGIERIMGSSENVGILQAFIEMVEATTTPYFIFAECDFPVVQDEAQIKSVLDDCIKLITEENVKVIRLRDRYNPGKPLHSRTDLDVDDSGLEAHDYTNFVSKAEMVHFVKDPEKKLPGVFTVVDAPNYNNRWYICTYEHYHWSNNIYMAETKFLKEVVLRLIKESHSTGNESTDAKLNTLELIMSSSKNQFEKEKVASGPGLFMHKRIDDCLQYCDRA
jgi:hypothetical protein